VTRPVRLEEHIDAETHVVQVRQMIARASRFGNLVFDRDAIVRAALRAYVETYLARLDPRKRHNFPASAAAFWLGDLQRGAFINDNVCGSYEVVAWTAAGVVGLAFELGWGPLEQLGLSVDAVTGGPDDVRGAVPGLPAELEPAFVMAVSMLGVGPEHGQRDAGVGFWLYGDCVAGTLSDDPTATGWPRGACSEVIASRFRAVTESSSGRTNRTPCRSTRSWMRWSTGGYVAPPS